MGGSQSILAKSSAEHAACTQGVESSAIESFSAQEQVVFPTSQPAFVSPAVKQLMEQVGSWAISSTMDCEPTTVKRLATERLPLTCILDVFCSEER